MLVLAAVIAATAGGGAAQGRAVQAGPQSFTRPALPTECATPYPNAYAANRGPSNIEPLPFDNDASVYVEDRVFDTDGDGTRDVYIPGFNGDTAVVHRGDGDLTFPAGSLIKSVAFDLDGDGRTDPLVISNLGQPIDQKEIYIVPGITAPGAVDLDVDGIKLSSRRFEGAANVFDQDDDGADDFQLSVGVTVEIFSGADVMAPGPGGTFTGRPAKTIAGDYIGYAAFDPEHPSLITSTNARVGGEGVTLTVHGVPEYQLVVNGTMSPLTNSGGVTFGAQLNAQDDRLWITLGSGSRSGSFVWAWELTDLCLGVREPVGVESGTATPATPVAADPNLTG